MIFYQFDKPIFNTKVFIFFSFIFKNAQILLLTKEASSDRKSQLSIYFIDNKFLNSLRT